MEKLAEREERWRKAIQLAAGTVASSVFNAQRTKRSQKVWQPKDFLPEPVRPMSELHTAMRAWAEGMNRRHEA